MIRLAPLICFNGIDGSGKTTQAHRLVSWLNAAGYPAVYVWSGGRTSLTRPFTRLAKRLLGGGRRAGEGAGQPSRGEHAPASPYLDRTRRLLGGRRARSLWLYFSVYEHALKIWATVLPPLLRGQIVVCDRYLYDSIVTTALLSGSSEEELKGMLRPPPGCRVPTPSRWFFLDLPAEIAWERKGEEVGDYALLERRIALYRVAAAHLGMLRVDARATPDELTACIASSVAALLTRDG